MRSYLVLIISVLTFALNAAADQQAQIFRTSYHDSSMHERSEKAGNTESLLKALPEELQRVAQFVRPTFVLKDSRERTSADFFEELEINARFDGGLKNPTAFIELRGRF